LRKLQRTLLGSFLLAAVSNGFIQVIGVLVGVKIESHRESKSNSMIDVV